MDAMEQRVGDWIETYSGVHYWPADPRPEDVVPQDIAHALSQECRFNSHTRWFYSVAQHCLLCAELAHRQQLPAIVQLRALLHDAPEAYCRDIPRPIKPWLRGYKEIEGLNQIAVFARFGLPLDDSYADAAVKRIDDLMLHMEARKLMPVAAWATEPGVDEIARLISYEPMRYVEERFLVKLADLRLETGNITFYDS